MPSKHSLYKSESRWSIASDEAKTRSSFQRKINCYIAEDKNSKLIIKTLRHILNKHGELFNKLVEEDIVSKEYLKPYLLRYKETKEEFKKSGE
jgi:hypothetical protein